MGSSGSALFSRDLLFLPNILNMLTRLDIETAFNCFSSKSDTHPESVEKDLLYFGLFSWSWDLWWNKGEFDGKRTFRCISGEFFGVIVIKSVKSVSFAVPQLLGSGLGGCTLTSTWQIVPRRIPEGWCSSSVSTTFPSYRSEFECTSCLPLKNLVIPADEQQQSNAIIRMKMLLHSGSNLPLVSHQMLRRKMITQNPLINGR